MFCLSFALSLHEVGNDKDADISIPEPRSYDVHLGLSRLRSEFEVLDFLGKGGFGSVTKVVYSLFFTF